MLTSFFGKSNPINFIILGIFLILGYFFGALREIDALLTLPLAVRYLFYFLIVVFFIFLMDFIIRKNKLTKANNYALFIFAAFLVMMPTSFLNGDIILANLFVLLAFRRIFSLNNGTFTEKKILDASIWLAVASLFYFWALLFYFVLLIGIFKNTAVNHKRVLIPIVGFFGVCSIATAFFLVKDNSFAWIFDYFQNTSLDFKKYSEVRILLPVSLLLALLIWASTNRAFNLSNLSRKDVPNTVLVLFFAAIAILVAVLSPEKTGAELLFLFAPTAIIAANYLENLEEFWFKEILLWLIFIFPIILWFL